MGTISNLKYRFNSASMLMKIVYINILVFLALRIAGIVCHFAGIDTMQVLSLVELPSSLTLLAKSPWTIITYMFSHYDIFHILFNMLVLYWFGSIFSDFFTHKQLCALYIIGGIGGGVLYMAAYNLLPALSMSSSWLIGASASVMAIVIAIAMKVPEYKLNLLLFGSVSLKWIAIFYIAVDLLSINSDNMGGHIAHIGGALTGLLFTMMINKGIDITNPINRIFDLFANGKGAFRNISVKHKVGKKTQRKPEPTPTGSISKEDENTLDSILDKIKKSGYASLTEDEKRRLFQVSSKKQ